MRDPRQAHPAESFTREMASVWAIGIYAGDSPLILSPSPNRSNPVLTYLDVPVGSPAFVADPFMIRDGDLWLMFFEVFDRTRCAGEIGLATSRNGWDWAFEQIVLAEPYHLSYPYVFEWQGEYYMTPETLRAESVQLYKAVSYPTRWDSVTTLVNGEFADPSIFRYEDRWWMFACSTPGEHDTLRLYFADELTGPWVEHPKSPVIHDNKSLARPAGRVLVYDDRIIRFAQDCAQRYGGQVRACEISRLTPTDYEENECVESPVLKAKGSGWNELGMHHLDAQQLDDGSWIACVDGMRAGFTAIEGESEPPEQVRNRRN